MPMGVPTKSKTETPPKICETLGGIHTDVSIIDEITKVEVDADSTNVTKTIELIGINEEKIVELTTALIVHDDDVGAEGANLIAEEVTVNSVDEVLDTSIAIIQI